MTRGQTRLIVVIAALTLAGLIAAVASLSGKESQEEIEERVPVMLNETLTNSMSDSLGLDGLDSKVKAYIDQWQMKGASLSIMKNDSLLYSKGYGWADKGKKIPMEPGNILRMASVSKLITATGIMVLQERGLLTLKDTVFGAHGILNDSTYISSITDPYYYKITVEDLLRHKGGFTQRGGDPMFSTRYIMMQNGLKTAPDHDNLLKICLRRRLGFEPGTSQAYSNLGYMILSMVIEKVSGQDYETFMQENVLEPAGCHDFKIANNYYDEKYDNEVRNYPTPDEGPVDEYNNSGKMVERCYGGNDIHALSGAGAWVASTAELCRFVASIDGKPSVPDIISEESVAQMTEYFDENTYSLGWNDTKPDGEWTRTGTFSGTTALIKYYPDGECWIFIANTSTWKGPGLARYTTALFNELRTRYSSRLPKRDLFWE